MHMHTVKHYARGHTLSPLQQFLLLHAPLILIGLLVVLYVGRELLPGDTMFLFHDQTQYARIIEFARALTRGEVPPATAQGFNFGIGYPVFRFYAPLAYWIASAISLSGVDVIDVFRLSMLSGLLIGYVGVYAWVAQTYRKEIALIAASLYVSSPWIASEIFVRGNMATVWFMALAPWSLYVLRGRSVLSAALIIALTLVTHNALSLLWLPILTVYGILAHTSQRRRMIKGIVVGTLFACIFWVPAFAQLHETYALEVARLTRYADHFLCISQIWTTQTWGYGGSAVGCSADGMSFMLGKIQLVLAGVGLGLVLLSPVKRRMIMVQGLIFAWMILLTTYDSASLWQAVPALQSIQFPWRLLSIAHIFGIGLGAHGLHVLGYQLTRFAPTLQSKVSQFTRYRPPTFLSPFPIRYSPLALTSCVAVCVSALVIAFSSKYFHGQSASTQEIARRYASDAYIRTQAAFAIPEYVPKTVDYQDWITLKDTNPSANKISVLRAQFDAFTPSHSALLVGVVFAIAGGIILIWLH